MSAVMGSRAPSGVVSFLFTDIVGSMTLWETTSEMATALDLHDHLVVDAITVHDGFVFSNTGDGFAAAFHDPVAAVLAAAAAQEALALADWPPGAEISARMGIHVGRADERGDNYFGPPVNRAARLMSVAGPRQLLVSADVQAAVGESLPAPVSMHGLGRVQLKDVAEPMEIFSVETPYVRRAHRPEAETRRVVDSLPVALTDLIGREADLARLATAVVDHRLVSIVGPGGAGKTSLAIEVARSALPSFGDGAWFVALTDVGESTAVVGAIGRALAVTNASNSVDQLVATALRNRHLLLVVDNCEHVLDGVVDAVGNILSSTRSVHVLVTSRTPLHVVGEVVDILPPLDLEVTVDEPSAAARLFVERAAHVGTTVEESEMGHVEALCAALDGLPLAIELAAARSRSISPQRLLAMVDQRFDLLVSPGSTGDRRHQTLRALVQSSYELLDTVEQRVFDRFGAFAGSFDLDDAVAIAAGAGASSIEVINALAGLVDQSLVQRGRDEGAPYQLLETLRQYALERLRDDDAESRTRDDHARWFRELAANVRRRCFGPFEYETSECVRLRRADFEDAVGWSAARGDLDTALGIVVDLHALAALRGWRHAPSWLAHLLREPPDPLPDRWAEFLAASASMALHTEGSSDRAVALAHEAVALDPENPQAHIVLAQTSPTAEACLEHAARSLTAGRVRSEPLWEMSGRVYECFGLILLGRYDEAQARAGDLQKMAADLGDRSSVGWARYLVARSISATDPARAMVLLDEARAIADETANPQLEINARRQQAAALITGLEPEAAEVVIRRGVRRSLELGEIDHALRTCSFAAMTFALRGEDEAAARLFGRLGLPLRSPAERPVYRRILGDLRDRLGDRYDELAASAAVLTADEVIELTLATIERAR